MDDQAVPEKLTTVPDGGVELVNRRPSSVSHSPIETTSAAEVKYKKQKIAFGMNRWAVAAFYTVYCFLCGPSYFSWASLKSMLVIDKAYSWLCDPSVTDQDSDQFIRADGTCRAQEQMLMTLFTICLTTHFVAAAVFGTALDSLGPKITALCGVSLQIIGWILIGSGSQAVPTYIPGFIIMGAGLDGAFFPCINGANLFPKYMSTVIAVFGSARSASFYVIYILEQVVKANADASFSKVVYGFVGLGLGFCLLVAIFVIPLRPFVVEEVPTTTSHRKKSLKAEDLENVPNAADSPRSRRGSERSRRSSFVGIASGGSVIGLGDMVEQPKVESRKDRLRYFWKEVSSIYYWPVMLLFVLTLQRVQFLAGSTGDLILGSALEFYKIVSPLSFIPCPLLGWLADKYGIMLVMFICNTSGTLMIVFAMIPSIPAAAACQYLSVIMYCLHVSFLLSQIYCYVADTFIPRNMGKLIGLICATAGLLALVTIPMYKYATTYSFFPMMGLQLGESALIYGLLVILLFAKRRHPTLSSPAEM